MITPQFSERAIALKSSAIREILKVTERPEMISFAGGLPSTATFPLDAMQQACERIFTNNPNPALQYGPTEGYGPLREWIAQKHNVPASRIILTTGSQQALDLVGKVFIDENSPVFVETPTYLGALQAFSLFKPNFISVETDEFGIIPDRLPTSGARFMYVLPNFQNPTGRTMSLERRQTLVKRAQEINTIILEDNPYGDLSYSGETHPTLLSMAPDNVIYLGSFSKILAPGLRVGYIIAPEAIITKIVQAKQAADLHTPSFTQRMIYEVVSTGLLDTHIPFIRQLYAAQCEAMMEALDRDMPKEITWNRPSGGMFTWLDLPEHMDSMEILKEVIQKNVAYVPGAPFYANHPKKNTLRLSFVTVSQDKIREGVGRFAEVIKKHI